MSPRPHTEPLLGSDPFPSSASISDTSIQPPVGALQTHFQSSGLSTRLISVRFCWITSIAPHQHPLRPTRESSTLPEAPITHPVPFQSLRPNIKSLFGSDPFTPLASISDARIQRPCGASIAHPDPLSKQKSGSWECGWQCGWHMHPYTNEWLHATK